MANLLKGELLRSAWTCDKVPLLQVIWGVYNEIDVSLDTFPFTGGVTTCESLWMGVPVLSLCGVRPAGRNAAALLASVGLNDWIVNTPEEFVALGVRVAGELQRLAELRGAA